jgi:competence protein ComEC
VRRLDLVVISHPHADHFAGLLEAIGDLEVGTLVDHVQVVSGAEGAGNARAAPGGDEAAAYLALRRELSEDGCRYVLAGTGHSVAVDGVVVRLFAPVRPLIVVDGPDPWAERSGAPTGDELNGASVVAVVSAGGIDVLIPGDAEADVLAGYPLPPVEAIVVSHHGSRGAVSKALLERLGVRAAFISVGEGNSFGHPNPGTLSVLQEEVGTVVRTDTSGWVSCRVQGDRMVITTERTPTR